jgi:hypothetical protein
MHRHQTSSGSLRAGYAVSAVAGLLVAFKRIALRSLRMTAIAILSCATVAAAAAGPHLPNHLIVPGRSVAGVRLGESARSAIRSWGLSKYCFDLVSGGCDIPMRANSDVSFTYVAGRVTRIDVDSGYNGSYVFPKALARLKTATGIHLGLRTNAIAEADPAAQKLGFTHYFIDGPGKACTVLATTTRIVGITILDGKHKVANEELCSVARHELKQAAGQPTPTDSDALAFSG